MKKYLAVSLPFLNAFCKIQFQDGGVISFSNLSENVAKKYERFWKFATLGNLPTKSGLDEIQCPIFVGLYLTDRPQYLLKIHKGF